MSIRINCCYRGFGTVAGGVRGRPQEILLDNNFSSWFRGGAQHQDLLYDSEPNTGSIS